MAGQEPCLGFTGSLYNISAYKGRIWILSSSAPKEGLQKG
jgi:hypothetical protein